MAKANARIIFYLTISIALFWVTWTSVNVYRFAVVGAICELLWLPMIAALFAMPLLLVYLVFKTSKKERLWNVGSLLIMLLVIGYIVWKNN